jgi:hypothetical protein
MSDYDPYDPKFNFYDPYLRMKVIPESQCSLPGGISYYERVDAEEVEAGPAEETNANTERRAMLVQLVKDSPRAHFSVKDAAIIFEVTEQAIRNWIEEGSLIRPTRGKVTAESVRQLYKLKYTP